MPFLFKPDDLGSVTYANRIERIERMIKYLCWYKGIDMPTEEEFIAMEKNYYARGGE